MRSLAAGMLVALASGGVAMAAPAASVVASLVTSVCMPSMQAGAFQLGGLPPGGRKLAAAEKAQLDIADDLADWRFEADDFVVLQLRSDNGCDVFTHSTGGPNFLPTLRRAVTERYGKPQSIRLKPPEPDPELGHISYWVGLPRGASPDTPAALVLAVTYTKASAHTQKRTFYVGVITATRKPN